MLPPPHPTRAAKQTRVADPLVTLSKIANSPPCGIIGIPSSTTVVVKPPLVHEFRGPNATALQALVAPPHPRGPRATVLRLFCWREYHRRAQCSGLQPVRAYGSDRSSGTAAKQD